MFLDLATLHFASATSRCAYVIVFLVMALSQRGQIFLWHWMGAMAASMAGSFIMMGVPPETLPSVPVTMVIYWLYGASLVLSWTGFRSFFGRPVKIGLGAFLAVLPAVLYPIVLATGLSTRFALAAVFANCSAVAALTSYESFRRMPGVARLWSQYIEAVAFGAYALILLLSIGMLLGTDRPIASAESARASLILDQVAGVFVYFGYVAMTAERANRRLVRIAETDPLTELYNRRGLAEALHQRFADRDGYPSAGLLIADIDHFKVINDGHGHEGGDRILMAFAKRMRSAFRGTDLVARWGGEEFLVVLPGATQRELAAVAERLRASVAEEPFSLRTGALAVTISIGITTMDPNDNDFEQAVQRADAALYAAKSGGRNRVCSAPAAALPDGVPKNDVQEDGVQTRCDDAAFA